MRKAYETPKVDKIAFNYRDQVVAASGVSAMGDPGDQNVIGNNGYYDQIGKYIYNVIKGIWEYIFG